MRKSIAVKIGGVTIGGGAPIVIQSMTDTITSDIKKTVSQILTLYHAGSELVRITVDNEEAANAVPYIKEKLLKQNCYIPLVGDFHYNGHILVSKFPDCAQALDKYRINPGNVGFGEKKDSQFTKIIEKAIKYDKPVRIGVNWGSIDRELLASNMNANRKLSEPFSAHEVMQQTLIQSVLGSADYAKKLGLSANKIIVSSKVSNVCDLIKISQELAKKCSYPIHLGLTEAGMGIKGIVASSISLGCLLYQGIGDTIRVSLTPKPKESRTAEVKVCQEILQSLNLKLFVPTVSSCPGCGRTSSTFFRELADEIQNYLADRIIFWKQHYIGVEKIKIAVMGCIVNGPGESKHANIGISLPGKGETAIAPVFIDGKKTYTLKGNNIAKDFMNIINNYIHEKCLPLQNN